MYSKEEQIEAAGALIEAHKHYRSCLITMTEIWKTVKPEGHWDSRITNLFSQRDAAQQWAESLLKEVLNQQLNQQ